MNEPAPIYLGSFPPIYRGDIDAQFISIASELGTGETVLTAEVTAKDATGNTVAGVISAKTITTGKVDFLITAPTIEGVYTIWAVLTTSAGEKKTRFADLIVT